GGSGVWGEHGMSAHPDLDRNDAARMVDYIIGNPENNNDALGTKGTLKPESPDFELEAGSYVLRASYKDKGTDDAKSLRTEELIVLKSPFLKPHNADYKKSTEILTAAGNAYYAVGDSSYIGYKSLDLNKVSSIVVYIQNSRRSGAKGGHIELRLKAPDGDLVARSTEIVFEEKEQRRRSPAGTNPVEWRRQNSLQAVITLPTNISGFQDVFFVFRNEKAISNEYLMQVLETGFMEK
ncbi:MAG: cytochrome c, partial [Arcticibacterium sp.]